MPAESPVRIFEGRPAISCEAGGFRFGNRLHTASLLICADGVYSWDAPPPGVQAASRLFDFIDAKRSLFGDFLLIGSGSSAVFPDASFVADLERRGLGVEIMNTAAACRTYNVLLGERRLFAAWLFPADSSLSFASK